MDTSSGNTRQVLQSSGPSISSNSFKTAGPANFTSKKLFNYDQQYYDQENNYSQEQYEDLVITLKNYACDSPEEINDKFYKCCLELYYHTSKATLPYIKISKLIFARTLSIQSIPKVSI